MMGAKVIPRFPSDAVVMFKGTALVPSRFWTYIIVSKAKMEKYQAKGYALSYKLPTDIVPDEVDL